MTSVQPISVTRETLANRLWSFRRSDGTEIGSISLERDGSLSGITSPNERRWDYVGRDLAFLGEGGDVTTRFHSFRTVRERLELTGDFLPLNLRDHHELHEIEIALDWESQRANTQEILSVSAEAVTFRSSARVVAALASLGIFFGRSSNRFSEADIIIVPRDGRTEPYCSFSLGNRITSMGAFSYTESALPDMHVGRYCSIAMGLEVFRDRHPVEWATTSSINYDFHPVIGYRSFIAAQEEFNKGEMSARQPPRQLEKPPVIKHDVWIGQNVQLARNITLGTGSVIAAGAIVTRDVDPYSIVGGVPAKRLRQRFSDVITERLLASAWWRHGPDLLRAADVTDPAAFLDVAEAWKERPAFRPRYVRAADLLARLNEPESRGTNLD